MAEIIIKQAVESDVDSVAAIVKRYRDFQGVKEQYIEEIASFIRARISGSESVILIAISQASGAVIGFVQLYPVFSTVSLQRQWLLNDFFVDEGERGAGVGSALMEAVKERFRNAAKGFILVTAKTNAGAKRFYEKHGWMTGSFDFYTYYYGTDDS